MKNNIKSLITSIIKNDKINTVSKPKSNWRVKVYPKPTIWVTKETLKK